MSAICAAAGVGAAGAGRAARAAGSGVSRAFVFVALTPIQSSPASGAGEKILNWAAAGVAIATAAASVTRQIMAVPPQRIRLAVACSIWSAALMTLEFIS